MAKKVRIDMTGQRFGRLVGIGFDHRTSCGHAHWLFRCDCGKEFVAAGGNVRSGRTASCGCLHREICAARLTRHGHRTARRHEPTYRAWQAMRQLHGAGELCPSWREDFAAFLADMGERPAATRLVRHDPNVCFRIGNCAWALVDDRAARAVRGWIKRRNAGDGTIDAQAQIRSSPGDGQSMRCGH